MLVFLEELFEAIELTKNPYRFVAIPVRAALGRPFFLFSSKFIFKNINRPSVEMKADSHFSLI